MLLWTTVWMLRKRMPDRRCDVSFELAAGEAWAMFSQAEGGRAVPWLPPPEGLVFHISSRLNCRRAADARALTLERHQTFWGGLNGSDASRGPLKPVRDEARRAGSKEGDRSRIHRVRERENSLGHRRGRGTASDAQAAGIRTHHPAGCLVGRRVCAGTVAALACVAVSMSPECSRAWPRPSECIDIAAAPPTAEPSPQSKPAATAPRNGSSRTSSATRTMRRVFTWT